MADTRAECITRGRFIEKLAGSNGFADIYDDGVTMTAYVFDAAGYATDQAISRDCVYALELSDFEETVRQVIGPA